MDDGRWIREDGRKTEVGGKGYADRGKRDDGRWTMDEKQIRSVVHHPSEAVFRLPSVVIAKRSYNLLPLKAKRLKRGVPPTYCRAALVLNPDKKQTIHF